MNYNSYQIYDHLKKFREEKLKMSNLKKHSILILMAMLILVLIPMSFAADVDDTNATDVIGVNDMEEDNLDLSSADESDVLGATPLTLNVDDTYV